MNNLFLILDKYKYPILAVLLTFFGAFFYLLFSSYEKSWEVEGWNFSSDAKVELMKDDLEINPEDIEILSGQPKDVKSIARDGSDQREKTMKDDWSADKPMSTKDIVKSVKDLEKQYFKEAGGESKRQKILEEKIQTEEKIKQKQVQTSKGGDNQNAKNGGDKSYAGNVMVDWVLSGRDPHQNNNYYVRNPGYTCGEGSSGVVVVKIKVDQAGNVTSASVVNSSNANGCMLEQAKKYAMISRFAYSKTAPAVQEGTIKYTFVSQ
jgi:TonB family protein